MKRGQWPVILPRLNRCQAWFYGPDAERCGRLLWPWQDVVSQPESPRRYEHHECHHRSTQSLWSQESDDWRTYLNCEHAWYLTSCT